MTEDDVLEKISTLNEKIKFVNDTYLNTFKSAYEDSQYIYVTYLDGDERRYKKWN